MLRNPQIRVIAILAIAYLIAVELVSFLPKSPASPCIVNPADYGPYYAEKNECPALHVLFVKAGAGVFHILGDPHWVTAISTIVLAFATAFLFVTTRDLVRGAEVTSRRQLRAYVSVVIGSASFQERDKNIRFEARPLIINAGQTPAHDVAYWANAAILPIPIAPDFAFPPPENFRWVGGAVLGPRHDFIANATVPDFVADDDVEAIKQGLGQALCVWGRVAYRDIFGAIQFTEFSQILVWLPDGNVMGRYERHNRAT